MTNVIVSKIEEKEKSGAKGPYTLQVVSGTTDGGEKFTGTAFKPVLNGVVRGERYSFDVTVNGVFNNVTKSYPLPLSQDEITPHTPPAKQTLPPKQTPPPPPHPAGESKSKQDSIQSMHDEKRKDIRISVALNDATELMSQFVLSDRNMEEMKTAEQFAVKTIEIADIFLEWLTEKGK